MSELRAVESADSLSFSRLVALEAICFDDPWSAADLAVYLGSGAVVAFLDQVAGTSDLAAYAIFQLLPAEAELLRIGVLPELRGRGAGTNTLRRCLLQLETEGRGVCHLEVRAGNAPARALYERLGFRSVGCRSAYYADGEDAVRYLRDSRSGSG